MKQKTATLIGATGLIGGHLLDILIQNETYQRIRVIVRKSISINHPKVKIMVIDFADSIAFKNAIVGSDAVFCAVGTTMKNVKGDKVAYRKVDYDIPVSAAQFCKELGCPVFLLVSAVGANAQSNNFYLSLKGEVEDKIKAMGIASSYFFRPSILLGNRQEFRLGERIGIFLIKAISFLLPSVYKPIKAATVANAMLKASKQQKAGAQIWHYREMMGK